MVALLIELLKEQNQEVVVVSTPQNIKENGRDECIKSLLKFSPKHGKGATNSASPQEAAELLGKFTPKLRKKDFVSFRQFHSQYMGKDLNRVRV